VVAVGETGDGGGSERSGGVHARAGVVDGEEVACEQRQTDADLESTSRR
jgi:hypothetical protein